MDLKCLHKQICRERGLNKRMESEYAGYKRLHGALSYNLKFDIEHAALIRACYYRVASCVMVLWS